MNELDDPVVRAEPIAALIATCRAFAQNESLRHHNVGETLNRASDQIERLAAVNAELLAVMLEVYDSPKFAVTIGGNPVMVEALMERAFAVIRKAQGEN